MCSQRENEYSNDILGKWYPERTKNKWVGNTNTYLRVIFMRVQAEIIGSVENTFPSSATSMDLFT